MNLTSFQLGSVSLNLLYPTGTEANGRTHASNLLTSPHLTLFFPLWLSTASMIKLNDDESIHSSDSVSCIHQFPTATSFAQVSSTLASFSKVWFSLDDLENLEVELQMKKSICTPFLFSFSKNFIAWINHGLSKFVPVIPSSLNIATISISLCVARVSQFLICALIPSHFLACSSEETLA